MPASRRGARILADAVGQTKARCPLPFLPALCSRSLMAHLRSDVDAGRRSPPKATCHCQWPASCICAQMHAPQLPLWLCTQCL